MQEAGHDARSRLHFVYNTSRMMDEATDLLLIMAFFVLILILHVFGHIHTITERIKHNI